MFKLTLATHNQGKLKELKTLLQDLPIEIFSVDDFPDCPESEEPYATYVENARDKAKLVAEFCQTWALADDSGLEVKALKNKPGVYSARYAGPQATYQDNYQKILEELQDIPVEQRQAEFHCWMVLRNPQGKEYISQGTLSGFITQTARGDRGFGYDPIFQFNEASVTLAELDLEEKNKISHRTQALKKMKAILMDLIAA